LLDIRRRKKRLREDSRPQVLMDWQKKKDRGVIGKGRVVKTSEEIWDSTQDGGGRAGANWGLNRCGPQSLKVGGGKGEKAMRRWIGKKFSKGVQTPLLTYGWGKEKQTGMATKKIELEARRGAGVQKNANNGLQKTDGRICGRTIRSYQRKKPASNNY